MYNCSIHGRAVSNEMEVQRGSWTIGQRDMTEDSPATSEVTSWCYKEHASIESALSATQNVFWIVKSDSLAEKKKFRKFAFEQIQSVPNRRLKLKWVARYIIRPPMESRQPFLSSGAFSKFCDPR